TQTLFTTPGAFQTTFSGGFSDAFVTKLNAAGSALLYSTYLGGSGQFTQDIGNAIAVDPSGNAYVTGLTYDSNFPTRTDAFQPTFSGVVDAFFTELNTAGSALLYSTYLGGADLDIGSGLAVDTSGNTYVTGTTQSSDFPTTPGAFQISLQGSADVLITKFSFGIPFSCFRGKLEIDRDKDAFDLNAGFNLGPGGSINPLTEPVTLTIGTYSVTIPAGSFVKHDDGYHFEGVI